MQEYSPLFTFSGSYINMSQGFLEIHKKRRFKDITEALYKLQLRQEG